MKSEIYFGHPSIEFSFEEKRGQKVSGGKRGDLR